MGKCKQCWVALLMHPITRESLDMKLNLILLLFNSYNQLHFRLRNVEAAMELGIVGLHFKSTDLLLQDLSSMGIDIPIDEHRQSPDQPKPTKEHTSWFLSYNESNNWILTIVTSSNFFFFFYLLLGAGDLLEDMNKRVMIVVKLLIESNFSLLHVMQSNFTASSCLKFLRKKLNINILCSRLVATTWLNWPVFCLHYQR